MRINIIKNFIFIFAILSIISQPVFAKNLKFIQITDSHFGLSDAFSTRDTGNSDKILRKTIDDINGISNVSFVILTGDNIDHPNDDELKEYLKRVNKLHVPYYVVIGNHEASKSQNLAKPEYMKIVRKYSKNCRAKKPNYVFKKGGIVFIVADGAKDIIPGPAGYFRTETLAWLDKQLTKYQKEHVIIFQHFPIEPPYYNRSHETYNVEEYKKVIQKHNNIIAIISGHYHANGEKMVDGIYHASGPALIEPPHDYKIFEIENITKDVNQKPTIYTQLRHAEF